MEHFLYSKIMSTIHQEQVYMCLNLYLNTCYYCYFLIFLSKGHSTDFIMKFANLTIYHFDWAPDKVNQSAYVGVYGTVGLTLIKLNTVFFHLTFCISILYILYSTIIFLNSQAFMTWVAVSGSSRGIPTFLCSLDHLKSCASESSWGDADNSAELWFVSSEMMI